MITIEDVIAMKTKNNIPFGTQYQWLLQTIENDLISKSNGAERVKQLLSDYDYLSRLFIVYQFKQFGEDQIVYELMSILELDTNQLSLEDKYITELID